MPIIIIITNSSSSSIISTRTNGGVNKQGGWREGRGQFWGSQTSQITAVSSLKLLFYYKEALVKVSEQVASLG